MPDLTQTMNLVKRLLRASNVSLDEVPLSLLKQAVYVASNSTERQGKGVENKMRWMSQLGMITEIRNGIWRLN